MSKIFYFMGKSAAGKDTIFQKVQKHLTDLRTVVIYTTRPIREGEEDGVAYHFVTEERMRELEREGKIIELRYTASGTISRQMTGNFQEMKVVWQSGHWSLLKKCRIILERKM